MHTGFTEYYNLRLPDRPISRLQEEQIIVCGNKDMLHINLGGSCLRSLDRPVSWLYEEQINICGNKDMLHINLGGNCLRSPDRPIITGNNFF